MSSCSVSVSTFMTLHHTHVLQLSIMLTPQRGDREEAGRQASAKHAMLGIISEPTRDEASGVEDSGRAEVIEQVGERDARLSSSEGPSRTYECILCRKATLSDLDIFSGVI